MSAKSSKIIRNYVLREIVGTTVLSTLALTAILLYGNLSKHDEDLFRALSISPLLFLELISLMLPFALSIGLPFGFSLAVIFCVGRWSADREILAMQSLGMRKSFWLRPILMLSFTVSVIALLSSLHWSPNSRGAFENRIRDIAWQDFQSLIDSDREIAFDVNRDENRNIFGGLDSSLSQKMKRVTLSIGGGVGDIWQNVRILIFGEQNELLAILHAKKSLVTKHPKESMIKLFLEDVDYEAFGKELKNKKSISNFVSFKKWKSPVTFGLEVPISTKNIKRMTFKEFLKLLLNGNLTDDEVLQASKHFNKYASIAFSPFSICFLLVGAAMRKGRRETYANLFLGVLVCMFYFVMGTTLGESIGLSGYGWWLSNLFVLFAGFFALK